jgi:hypothetical protein
MYSIASYSLRATRILPKCVVLAAGSWFSAVFVVLAVLRMSYPFELEWMEGGVLDHVRRLQEGKALYGPPAVEFTPFIYTPLYYYASWPLIVVFGEGFFAMRLLSFAATVGTALLLFLLVRRESGRSFAAFVGSSLFLAGFRATGAWMDLARADSLALFQFLAAAYLIRWRPTVGWYVTAGVLLSLAFLTKQSTLIMTGPLLLYGVYEHPKPFVALCGTAVGLSGAAVAVFHWLSGGWFAYYVFELPRQHPWQYNLLGSFWLMDLGRNLPAAAVLILFVGLMVARRRCIGSAAVAFHLLLAAGMVSGSMVLRLHVGGYDNVLMPAFAAVSILCGVAVGKTLACVEVYPGAKRSLIEGIVCAGLLGQFGLLGYSPSKQLPTQADREAGQRLVRRLAHMEGQVWIPGHGYLACMVGKTGFAHQMAMKDVLNGGNLEAKQRLVEDMKAKITSRAFSSVIVDDEEWRWDLLEAFYRKSEKLFDDPGVFYPATGARMRPQTLYRLRM